MSGPCANYIVELLHRIDGKYDCLLDEMRRVQMELKSVQEVIKRREDERICYQKLVFDMLVSSLSSTNNIDGFEDGRNDFPMKRNNNVRLAEEENIEQKPAIMNMDIASKDVLHNSRKAETSKLLKFATIVVEPSVQSFVVGETSKSSPSSLNVCIV